jgi:hypothetical protein
MEALGGRGGLQDETCGQTENDFPVRLLVHSVYCVKAIKI